MQGVFFDLDGTLLNQEATQGLAKRFFQHFRLSLPNISAKTFFKTFRKVNQTLYEELMQKNISGIELLSQRFPKTLKALEVINKNDLALEMQQMWDELYYNHYSLFDQVIPMLSTLKTRNKTLAIITNGLIDIQIKKIQKFPELQKVMDVIIISEEYGINKPDPRIFQICLERTAITDPQKVLFVGNSIETDIEGAKAAGM
ncbi:MAG: HAD family hydrolase, partial [Candidatus Hodarchaeota archaeon]